MAYKHWFKIILILPLSASGLAAARHPKLQAQAATQRNPTLVRERQRVLTARPLGMYYYYDDTRGLASVEKNASQITLLGPQCFTMDADGIVRGGVPAGLEELARRLQIPVMPLLVNPGFDRGLASAVLRDPKKQERTASYLAYLANRENFVGWQLDLEYLDPADKARYTALARRVAAKLHRDGRLLSIAVTPRFSDRYPDTRRAEFRTGEWGAPFDYRSLGQIVDFMVLMAYDHHTSGTPPGPVAGHDWVKAALDYATRRVPRHKLLLGIPFYGREWVETAVGVLSRSLAYDDLRPLLERPDAHLQWHERWRVPWFQLRDESEVRTVWFDDHRSYREKLELARKYRLRGFAAWRLGTEDPAFWAVAAEMPKGETGKTPRASISKSRRAPSASR
jgi:spore germination protein